MHTAVLIVCGLILLMVGVALGFLFYAMVGRTSSYVGVMRIVREDDKVVYSLELNEEPALLEYVSEVVFKVETSDESSVRK